MKPVCSNIKTAVDRAGLVYLGCVSLTEEPHYQHFRRWLARGYQAEMHYLENNQQLRADPRKFAEGYHSALIVALPYGAGDRKQTTRPRVAQYARFRRDYHRLLRDKLRIVANSQLWSPSSYRIVVDSAPLLERALASRGGRGFIGKNTCFISPEHGSYLLLAEILTSNQLPVDEQPPPNPDKRDKQGGCGTCRRCQVHCPTGALNEDYTLDANKCLAYLTIENRGLIPERYWQYLDNYFYGCDICQIVCPYNRGKLTKSETMTMPTLAEIATLSEQTYRRYFAGTALTRAKRQGLIRNALIAMHVSNDPQLSSCLETVQTRADLRAEPLLQKTCSMISSVEVGGKTPDIKETAPQG